MDYHRHSAFLGVDADYRVHVGTQLLDETDGPMLKHGLQALQGQLLRELPTRKADRPDRDLLAERFEGFRKATT